MVNRWSRPGKRVHAINLLLRAPDGSAFVNCEHCGVPVAVALLDMHECGSSGSQKRSRVIQKEEELDCEHQPKNEELDFEDQPRSAFCCFMESFKKGFKSQTFLEIAQIGFDAWKSMSAEERQHYVIQAEQVNTDYEKTLLQENHDTSEVDDEADSAMVGKVDRRYEDHSEDYDDDDDHLWESWNTLESFYYDDWLF